MKRLIAAILCVVLLSGSAAADWYDGGVWRAPDYWRYIELPRYTGEPYQATLEEMAAMREAPTPEVIRISAADAEDAEAQLATALEYAPHTVVLTMPDAQSAADLHERYRDWRETGARIDAVVSAAWTRRDSLISVARSGSSVILTIERYADGWLAYVDTRDEVRVYQDEDYSVRLREVRAKIAAISGTEAERADKICALICDMADYDYAELRQVETGGAIRLDAHCTRGLVYGGKMVCGGFAYALQFALACSGIRSFEVAIKDGDRSHSYNKVRIDGAWVNLDVTQMEVTPRKPKLQRGFADVGCLAWVKRYGA